LFLTLDVFCRLLLPVKATLSSGLTQQNTTAQTSEILLHEKFCIFDCFGGGHQNNQQLIFETAEDNFEKILGKSEDLFQVFNCSKVCICKKRNTKMGIKQQ